MCPKYAACSIYLIGTMIYVGLCVNLHSLHADLLSKFTYFKLYCVYQKKGTEEVCKRY